MYRHLAAMAPTVRPVLNVRVTSWNSAAEPRDGRIFRRHAAQFRVEPKFIGDLLQALHSDGPPMLSEPVRTPGNPLNLSNVFHDSLHSAILYIHTAIL